MERNLTKERNLENCVGKRAGNNSWFYLWYSIVKDWNSAFLLGCLITQQHCTLFQNFVFFTIDEKVTFFLSVIIGEKIGDIRVRLQLAEKLGALVFESGFWTEKDGCVEIYFLDKNWSFRLVCTPFDALKVVMSVLLVLETKAKSLELFRLPPSIFTKEKYELPQKQCTSIRKLGRLKVGSRCWMRCWCGLASTWVIG